MRGDRRRHPDPSRVRGGDLRACLGIAARGVRPRWPRARGRARRAGHHGADALDARRVLERPRRLAVPDGLLRALPRGVAPRRLDPVHSPADLPGDRPLRRHAQPRWRPAGDRRVLRGARRLSRGRRQHRRPSRGRERRSRRAAAVRGAHRRCPARRRAPIDHRSIAVPGALAPPRPGHDRRRSRNPTHAHGQEARGSRQARARRSLARRRSRASTRYSIRPSARMGARRSIARSMRRRPHRCGARFSSFARWACCK